MKNSLQNSPLAWIASLLLMFGAAKAQVGPAGNAKDQPAAVSYGKYVVKVDVDPRLEKAATPEANLRLTKLRLVRSALATGYGLPTAQDLKGENLTPEKAGIKELEAEAERLSVGFYVHVEVSDARVVAGKKQDPAALTPNFAFRHRMWVKTQGGWRQLFDESPLISAEGDPITILKLVENPLYFAFPSQVLPVRITTKKRGDNGVAEFTASITNRHILPLTGFKPVVMGKVAINKEGQVAARNPGVLEGEVHVLPGKTSTFRFTVSDMSAADFKSIDVVLATEAKFAP